MFAKILIWSQALRRKSCFPVISLAEVLRASVGKHYTVYISALCGSKYELFAFPSNFARVFYFQPPKSTTLFLKFVRRNVNDITILAFLD